MNNVAGPPDYPLDEFMQLRILIGQNDLFWNLPKLLSMHDGTAYFIKPQLWVQLEHT